MEIKIHLKNIGKIGDYEVWLVDGSYMRKVVSENLWNMIIILTIALF